MSPAAVKMTSPEASLGMSETVFFTSAPCAGADVTTSLPSASDATTPPIVNARLFTWRGTIGIASCWNVASTCAVFGIDPLTGAWSYDVMKKSVDGADAASENVQLVPPLTAWQPVGLLAAVVPNVVEPSCVAPCLLTTVMPCVPNDT